jgi:hypothetical protein
VLDKVQRGYSYPRYMFANGSAGLKNLRRAGLNEINAGRRRCRPDLPAVTRKDAAAQLDAFAGPQW